MTAQNQTIIETERLIIRVPTINDLEIVQAAKEANWHELQKWMSWTSDDQLQIDALRHYIEEIVPVDHAKGGLHLQAFHKNTGDFVMASGLIPTDTPHIFDTGYWGNINYLGQGYATEMMKAQIDFAFADFGAERLELAYFEGNDKSRRVIEKCGFDFIETLPKAHRSFADGQLLDEHVYAMTRQKWEDMQ